MDLDCWTVGLRFSISQSRITVIIYMSLIDSLIEYTPSGSVLYCEIYISRCDVVVVRKSSENWAKSTEQYCAS